MPWGTEDASRHTRKARSSVAKRQWRDVANSVLRRGGSEGSAVRQANAAVSKRSRRRSRRSRRR